MSTVVTATPRAAVTPRPIDEWAQIIADDLTRAVAGIIAAGRHLQEAKAEVDHGEWLPLLQRLKIGERSAQMLMRIAKNEVLGNPNHWFALPTSWRTLYELATLSPEFVKAKIADGAITPEITREEVRALCSPVGRSNASVEETPPPDRRGRRDRPKRIPNMLITSWEDVDKFCEIVRHNLQVRSRRYAHPEDIDHDLTVGVPIMVSPASIQELDRYVALHPGMNRREMMEYAVETLCSGLRRLREEEEARIEREQRQKYEAAMAEKRGREALGGEAGAAT
jgi:hypothetical protein